MKFSSERAVYVQRDFFSDALFVRRLFGAYCYRDASRPDQCDALLRAMERGQIDRLVISNPYRTPVVQDLYKRLRAAALPYLIVERGALPRSLFLDVDGFLRDSRSYDRTHWDAALDAPERARLGAYRRQMEASDQTLERQSRRTGREATRSRLLNGRRRLCAVTLQMSTDAVTNHFIRPGLDYARFKLLLGEAISRHKGDWSFAVKAHPREPVPFMGGVPTDNDVNITDLVEAADAVVTFNSGTGVVAMLRDKPVGCFGDAFYGGPGLTAQLNEVHDFEDFLAAPERSFDRDTRDRFLHHLIFRLYSEVRFLGTWPVGPMSRPVAMQGRVVRVYDPTTRRSFELDRSRSRVLDDAVDREAERLRAWYRAATNRIAFDQVKSAGRVGTST